MFHLEKILKHFSMSHVGEQVDWSLGYQLRLMIGDNYVTGVIEKVGRESRMKCTETHLDVRETALEESIN